MKGYLLKTITDTKSNNEKSKIVEIFGAFLFHLKSNPKKQDKSNDSRTLIHLTFVEGLSGVLKVVDREATFIPRALVMIRLMLKMKIRMIILKLTSKQILKKDMTRRGGKVFDFRNGQKRNRHQLVVR